MDADHFPNLNKYVSLQVSSDDLREQLASHTNSCAVVAWSCGTLENQDILLFKL